MGIIRAVKGAVGGGLADQWLEVIEPDNMTAQTVMTRGVTVRPNDQRNRNRRGTEDIINNGSIIHVYPNQAMLLLDGGKVVDFTCEPGYFKVDNSAAPSLFAGGFGAAVKETFQRVKFGGTTPQRQIVVYLNLQEIRDIAFGTTNPVNYFDEFFNAELFFRAFGYYSIKMSDPLKFYAEVVDKAADRMEADVFRGMFLAEFLGQFQSALNRMSADGIRASHVPSRTAELTKYMREILQDDWNNMRGVEVQSVGIKSISYDEETRALLAIRNQGAMLGDANIREGFVQGAVARGMEAAGSNAGGAMQGFLGMGMGMNVGGMNQMSSNNQMAIQQQQIQQQQMQQQPMQGAAVVGMGGGAPDPNAWNCQCGQSNAGNFCQGCGGGKPAPAESWTCGCNQANEGNFCKNCGTAKPQPASCQCGHALAAGAKFCPQCGTAQ